jgi:anti-sigma regulatory factor (Ser/Thr protein kinase)
MSFFGEKVFSASLDVLDEIRAYVSAAAAHTSLEKKKIYKLQLSVDEIATNIISYAYQDREQQTGKIYIDAEVKADSLIIQVRDQGVPFDPRSKLEKGQETVSLSVEERAVGGLGIYLAITGVDKYEYEYMNGFNVNRFEVYLV